LTAKSDDRPGHTTLIEWEPLMVALPPRLKWVENSSEGRAWLRELPAHVKACVDRWGLRLDPPYKDSYVSIVFPAALADGSPAVLKIQYPHPESEHEAEALRRWNGQGAVRLLACEAKHHALLMERCEPGDPLAGIGADEALNVFVDLLPRLWINADKPFMSLDKESAAWAEQLPASWERAGRPFEIELLNAAVEALHSLRGTEGERVLLHQDLHGDNVLRATREPWLVIDPKPLVGEREFSLAPIIRAYEFGHSNQAVVHRLDKLTATLSLDRERARLWALAQTLAWSFEGDRVLERHLDTARWLWHA
jgi:streptomycin 6-kinase